MKIGRWIILALILVSAGLFVWKKYLPDADIPFVANASVPEQMVPEGVRIKVEVLNATKVKGLARKATMFLRDRGFDVVAVGTASQQMGSSLVLDRSNHPEWARLVGKALKAKVESRADSSRYLDITVLIGADWRPPPLPFYP